MTSLRVGDVNKRWRCQRELQMSTIGGDVNDRWWCRKEKGVFNDGGRDQNLGFMVEMSAMGAGFPLRWRVEMSIKAESVDKGWNLDGCFAIFAAGWRFERRVFTLGRGPGQDQPACAPWPAPAWIRALSKQPKVNFKFSLGVETIICLFGRKKETVSYKTLSVWIIC